jgi:hypothetical protein
VGLRHSASVALVVGRPPLLVALSLSGANEKRGPGGHRAAGAAGSERRVKRVLDVPGAPVDPCACGDAVHQRDERVFAREPLAPELDRNAPEHASSRMYGGLVLRYVRARRVEEGERWSERQASGQRHGGA